VLKLIPLMLILAVTVSALGILIASRIQSMQAFPMVMQIVVFPLIFLSGVFFPVSNVPVWLEVIAKINPVTYGVDAIRHLFINLDGGLSVSLFGHTMGILEDVAIVLAFGAATVIAAMWSFERLG
jgi:ABC-2 type transport system permease protein